MATLLHFLTGSADKETSRKFKYLLVAKGKESLQEMMDLLTKELNKKHNPSSIQKMVEKLFGKKKSALDMTPEEFQRLLQEVEEPRDEIEFSILLKDYIPQLDPEKMRGKINKFVEDNIIYVEKDAIKFDVPTTSLSYRGLKVKAEELLTSLGLKRADINKILQRRAAEKKPEVSGKVVEYVFDNIAFNLPSQETIEEVKNTLGPGEEIFERVPSQEEPWGALILRTKNLPETLRKLKVSEEDIASILGVKELYYTDPKKTKRLAIIPLPGLLDQPELVAMINKKLAQMGKEKHGSYMLDTSDPAAPKLKAKFTKFHDLFQTLTIALGANKETVQRIKTNIREYLR